MISVEGVSKFLGDCFLFRDVSFHVRTGDRIGLIGMNGTGKTTLLQVLLGQTEPDSGLIHRARHLRMGYLPQQWIPVSGKTVLSYAMDVDRELKEARSELQALQPLLEGRDGSEAMSDAVQRQAVLLERLDHLGGYDLEARAHKVLNGLGFSSEQTASPVAALSGGWRMRLALARLLLAEPDVLLLDEPTNHLDLEALVWLEDYLGKTRSAMIIISHDRVFLDRLVRRIFELEQGRLDDYPGNYTDYLGEKAQRLEIQAASHRNQQERIKQMERFIARNRYRKDRARQVQSRLKMLEKMDLVEAPVMQAEPIQFTFSESARSGKRVVELRGACKAYGEHAVYDGIDLVIERGDRVAFLGPNGSGKSTLLKMLAGAEALTGGQRVLGHQVTVGYYAQHQWEQLHPERTVLEEAASVAGDLSPSRLRSLLGAFLFRADEVLKKTTVLSGGEKARMVLCKLLLQSPNVLLLDEPTNHLDIPARDVLEQALRSFSGTCCFISHDRHFINAIATKVLVVETGCVHVFPGNYDDYQSLWRKRLAGPEGAEDEAATDDGEPRAKPAATPVRRDSYRKRLEAEWRNEWYRLKQPREQRLRELEAALDAAQQRLDRFNAMLGDPQTYRNGEQVQELQTEYQQCRREIEELTEQWERGALELEEMETAFWEQKESLAENRGSADISSLNR